MTLAQLRTRVKARLNNSTGVLYTDADVNAALNEGIRLFALLTLCVERKESWKPTLGGTWFSMLSLFPDWILPLRLRCHRITGGLPIAGWDGSPLWDESLWDELAAEPTFTMAPVRPATLQQLDALDSTWNATTGDMVKRYGTRGLDLLWIYPKPATEGTTVEITYAALPADIAGDSSVPEIPEQHHGAVVDFAIATLPFPLGGSELSKKQPEFQRFLAEAKVCAEWVRKRCRTLQYDHEPIEVKIQESSGLKEKAVRT